MQPSKLFIALTLLTLLSACGTEPDERVYGTWTEPLTGESIEFRRDGTLSWFGSEGTFAFKRSTNWANCIGLPGCPTGQVAIDVDDQSFRVSYWSDDFDAEPNAWHLGFRGFTAIPMDVSIGDKTAGGFPIYREGTVPSPFTLPGFERLDAGITSFHPYLHDVQTYNGELVAAIDGSLHRFNSQNATWEILDGPDSYAMQLAPQVIYTDENFSLDGGYTWQSLPFLDGSNHEGDTVAMGTTLYQTVRIDVNDEPRTRQTWCVDLTRAAPSWQLVGEMPAHDHNGREIVAITPANTLMRSAWEPEGVLLEISPDTGVSWTELENNCSSEVRAHTDGVYCGADDDSVLWYSLTTNNWISIAVDFGDIIRQPNRFEDALYVMRNDAVVRVETDGSETMVADLGPTPWGARVQILDDQIIVNSLTIWRRFL